MFKKLFLMLLALLMAVSPLQSYAGDLGSAFSNLLGPGSASTATAPGRYTSGARNVFVGGGVEMRFPRSNVTVFSVAPPSFSAGCQGISAHFGGFSFISGKEIEQLVRNIAQGAPGLVINLVIKTLCPMCEAVLQNMQKLAQFAAKSNMDSCRVGANLVSMLGDKLKPDSTEGSAAIAGACGSKATSVNSASEWGQANITVCNKMKDAVGLLNKEWANLEKGLYGAGGDAGGSAVKQDTSAERCSLGVGNCTWLVLKKIFPTLDSTGTDDTMKNRLLLMNLMGATLVGDGVSCGAGTKEAGAAFGSVTCLPAITAREAVGLFMCGTPPTGSESQIKYGKTAIWTEYCQNLFTEVSANGTPVKPTVDSVTTLIRNLPLMDCDLLAGDTDTNAYENCKTFKQSTVGDMEIIKGPGFLYDVQTLLAEAVERVRTNQSMGKDDTGRKIINLVNMAPYPLYQAINAAAVYPEAGQTLIDSMSLLVADHIAYAYFQQLLTLSAKSSYNGIAISPKMVNNVLKGMQDLRMEGDKNRGRLGKTIASQQAIMEEIRKVNLVIQQSVMSSEMLNMQKYANTINTNTAEPSTTGK